MMVDLQQVIESLVDRNLEHRREIDHLNREMKRAFDEIAALRTPSALCSNNHSTGDAS